MWLCFKTFFDNISDTQQQDFSLKSCWSTERQRAPGLVDGKFEFHTGSRGFDSHRRYMSERFFWCSKLDYPYLVCSELGNSCIRVAVDDCSVTECRPWRPPFQTVKTVHVHTKHYKHNENGRTAPGVRGHGSVLPSHLGNFVTGIVLQQRAAFSASFKKKKKMLVSKMQLWLWNICLSFSKILADNFFLVCKFYSLKYTIYGHDIWIREFSHVWNKGETGYSYIISLLKKHSVEFFILHNNIHGNFPLFRRFALKISVLSIYICMEIQLLKN